MDSAGADGGSRARRITDSDVARDAGVSRATVYYVLNDDPKRRIPETTRERVLASVDRLGYVPFGPARLLRGGRSTVVLLLTHGLHHATDLVATRIVTRLGAALEERGLHLIWQLDGEGWRDPSIDLAPVVVLSSSSVGEQPFDQAVSDYSVPVLEAFPGLRRFVAAAAEEQVRHLVARGRTRLAFVEPEDEALRETSEIRWEALREECLRRGIAAPRRLKLPPSRTAAGERLDALLEAKPELDGLCAVNDDVAFLLLAAAADAGIAVPGRVAIVGVDDHPFGRSAIPALSSVRSDVNAFVSRFAEQIAAATQGDSPAAVLLPSTAQVVHRASS